MFLNSISSDIINIISSTGYTGVVVLMAIESAAVPLPSEVILPFSGFLITTGRFSLWGVTMAGAIGSVIGSLALYYIGYFGGRPFIDKFGKYLLITHEDMDKADSFFKRYGSASNFIGRVLPLVRTFISLPAGISKVNIKGFIFYTFLGSFVWSLLLAWIGLQLGQNWSKIHAYFHNVDLILEILVALGVIWFIHKHIRIFIRKRKQK